MIGKTEIKKCDKVKEDDEKHEKESRKGVRH